MKQEKIFYLPKLRHNLELIESEFDRHGTPTCLIYDKVANQYYKISWQEYQILKYWQPGKPLENLVDSINQNTTLNVDQESIIKFINYLSFHNLLELPADSAASALEKKGILRARKSLSKKWRSSLFQRWRLINPDKFLDRIVPITKWLISKKTIYILAVILCVNLILLVEHWNDFINTFSYFFNWSGLIYFLIALGFIKIFHEFGHAYTAKYQGCHVTNIGVALLFFIFPILYTDVSDSWRLPKHRQRLLIDCGGIIAELSIAIILSFIWFFLDDGPFRSTVFMLATASWIMSLLVNLNPFIRYDGYYILSDLLQVKNLQTNSFNFMRWWMHRFIWGMKLESPLNLQKNQQLTFILYAIGSWIYRFFLFLGISLLIYHVFFKALGSILFLTMLVSLIIAPILKEGQFVWINRQKINMNKNLMIAVSICAFILIILFVPWKFRTAVPAVIKYQNQAEIYLKQAGYADKLLIKDGQEVQKGELLAVFDSAHLNNEIQQTKIDIQIIRSRLVAESERSEELGYQQVSQQDLIASQTKLVGLENIRQQLQVIAPISGKVVYINRDLVPGSYLEKSALLFEIVNPKNGFEIEAYIPANIIQYINWDKSPYFKSDELNSFKIPLTVKNIDLTRTKYLDDLYLASTSEGEIPVEYNKAEQKITVKDVYYKVLLSGKDGLDINKVTLGHVYFSVKSYNLFTLLWQKIFGTILRETTF